MFEVPYTFFRSVVNFSTKIWLVEKTAKVNKLSPDLAKIMYILFQCFVFDLLSSSTSPLFHICCLWCVSERDMTEKKQKPKVIIVGGCIAGIACSKALILTGWDVVMLEKTCGPSTGCHTGLAHLAQGYCLINQPPDNLNYPSPSISTMISVFPAKQR